MKNKIILVFAALIISSLWGCVSFTRYEQDVYTISDRDTTTNYIVQNAPGNRDNGVIFPSSRVFKSERYLLQHDSLATYEYPNFIRLGAFESAGLLFSGNSENGLGNGLFGIFPDLNTNYEENRGSSGTTFPGGLYRIGIVEYRLRWFRDAKNWTIGSSLFEGIFPDARIEKSLMTVLPLYVRKRYYIKETIPYVAVTPAVGLAWFPTLSQYINASVSLDLGSLSGLNLRAYLGFAAGQNSANSYQIRTSKYTDMAQTSYIPYFGLGISFLDFLNRVPETETEWKFHEHSGWNIGLLQFGLISSNSDYSAYANDSSKSIFNGGIFRFLHAETAIPFLNNQFYFGTSLFNLVVVGKYQWGMGILPLRFGYWQTVISDDLSLEPFIEYNYYPSSFIHLGGRLNLRLGEQYNVSAIIGYASGSTSKAIGSQFESNLGNPLSFSNAYIGLMVGIDKIFFPDDLRYNK